MGTNNGEATEPEKPKSHPVIFSERNLERWAIFGTSSNKNERLLVRKDRAGNVVEYCRIHGVGYKGKTWTLTAEHGRMMNLIKALFRKQGYPASNTIKVSSVDFYDFLVDIASMSDPSRRKRRRGNLYGDWTYDLLYILTATSIMFQSWKKKDGSVGVQRLNLLDGFEMYQRDHVGPNPTKGEFGKIIIKLNPVIADGLRANNTSPILLDVANSISHPTAWVLYRYVDKVLAKRTAFEIPVQDLAERLAIGHEKKSRLVAQFKTAAEKILNLDLTSGKLVESCIKDVNGVAWYRCRRLVKQKTKPASQPTVSSLREKALAEETEMREYVKRFNDLPEEERSPLAEAVDVLLKTRRVIPGAPGYTLSREIAITEVMEKYFSEKSNHLIHSLTNGPADLVLREKCLPENEYKGASDLRREASFFLSKLFPRSPFLALPEKKS